MLIFLAALWLGDLYTFKIWLDEYFLNSWYHNCERSLKCKCYCNWWVSKVNKQSRDYFCLLYLVFTGCEGQNCKGGTVSAMIKHLPKITVEEYFEI